jgi:hypothetical protein
MSNIPQTNDEAMNEWIDMWKLILEIEFNTKASPEEMGYADDGLLPWIHLNLTEEDLSSLIDPDAIVVPYRSFTLVLDYPFLTPKYYELQSQGDGFSRKQLIMEIGKIYFDIFKNNPEDTFWHELDQLDMSALLIFQDKKGKIYWQLDIDS